MFLHEIVLTQRDHCSQNAVVGYQCRCPYDDIVLASSVLTKRVYCTILVEQIRLPLVAAAAILMLNRIDDSFCFYISHCIASRHAGVWQQLPGHHRSKQSAAAALHHWLLRASHVANRHGCYVVAESVLCLLQACCSTATSTGASHKKTICWCCCTASQATWGLPCGVLTWQPCWM